MRFVHVAIAWNPLYIPNGTRTNLCLERVMGMTDKEKKVSESPSLPDENRRMDEILDSPSTAPSKQIASQAPDKEQKLQSRDNSPKAWESNLRNGTISSNTNPTSNALYTPNRNPLKDNMRNGTQSKRLSRHDFDTRQYRSDNKSSAFEKKQMPNQKLATRKEENDLPNATSVDNSSSYNAEICQIMNDFYNSPTTSKAHIPRILHEVKRLKIASIGEEYKR